MDATMVRRVLPLFAVVTSLLVALSGCSSAVTDSNDADAQNDAAQERTVTPETESDADAPIPTSALFPADNIWNTPVDTLPVHEYSDLWVATIGAETPIHPDFGSGTWEGETIGIPYDVIGPDQPLVDISFYYPDESDPGPYPIPPDATIEGGPDGSGDRHVILLDSENRVLYEVFDAWPQDNGTWEAGSGAIYDLDSNDLRPHGWTSADAAGLPILPGLIDYDEVTSDSIDHALRFTADRTAMEFVWPARHFASELTGDEYPPMGARFRLKADVDISGYSPKVQVILQALKIYGMLLADNGASWFLSGTSDPRWDNDMLHEMKQGIEGQDFEAVDTSILMIDPGSGQAVSQ